MKLVKRVFIGLIVLFFVVIGGAAMFLSTLDLNKYKAEIQEEAKAYTGRDLLIDGNIDIKIFPWLGLEFGDVALSNAEGFADAHMIRIGKAGASVQIMPLLKKELRLGTVTLHDMDLSLESNVRGVTNWADLIKKTEASAVQGNGENKAESKGSGFNALDINGLDIQDAQIHWRDDATGANVVLNDISIITDAIKNGTPFGLESAVTMINKDQEVEAEISGVVTLDLMAQKYQIENLDLNLNAIGEALPPEGVELNLTGTMLADLVADSVTMKSIKGDVAGIPFNADMSVKSISTELAAQGDLNIESFSPKKLMDTLDLQEIETADSSVLESFSLSTKINANTESASLENVNIKLDETVLSGSIKLSHFTNPMPSVRYNLTTSSLDVDRYLPPSTDSVDESNQSEAEKKANERIVLPTALMRDLDIEGSLKVNEFKIMNLKVTDIIIPLKAESGDINLNGIKAALYDGDIDASLGLNVQKDTPKYRSQFKLKGIQVLPLMTDFNDMTRISGAGSINLDIKTTGNSVIQLEKALDGNLAIDFRDGAINGINIPYEIRKAKAKFSGKTIEADVSEQKTDFSRFSVSTKLKDGIASSSDLDIKAPYLRFSGEGQVDWLNEDIDYTLRTLISGTDQGQGGADLRELDGVKLKFPIKTTFKALSADPAKALLAGLNLDLESQAKAKLEAEKAKLKAKLAKQEAEARAKLEKEKAKAKAKLEEEKAKLKAEAETKIKAEKQKIEDKLKDKLNEGLGKLFN